MHVAENLLASGLGQLPGLGVNALALTARRYPRVAVSHLVRLSGRSGFGEVLRNDSDKLLKLFSLEDLEIETIYPAIASVAEVRFGPVQHHFLLNLEPEPTTEGRT